MKQAQVGALIDEITQGMVKQFSFKPFRPRHTMRDVPAGWRVFVLRQGGQTMNVAASTRAKALRARKKYNRGERVYPSEALILGVRGLV